MIKKEGYKAHNIVLLGDSAGGGLVPAVAIQLQREGEPLPAALGMFSPYVDLRGKGDTTRTLNAVDPLIAGTNESSSGGDALVGMAEMYVGGNATLAEDPLASPVLADYAALFPKGTLPPTLIQVGLREILLSDAVRQYHTMKAAAPAPGHVVLSPYEGMWHVFQMFLNIPEAAVASKEMGDYFSRALKGHICK
jgi:acetyl esterase/lipase